MNERIKLLADQAGLYASEQYPGSFVKYDPKWFEFYNKKFAEVIVRECAHVLVKEMNRLDELDRVLPAQTMDTAQALIKQHFGVEL